MADFDLSKITGREPPVETDEDMMNALADALGDADALRTERDAMRARVAELEADAARWRFLRLRGLTFVPGRNTFLLDYLRQRFFADGGIDAAIDGARLSGNKDEVRK